MKLTANDIREITRLIQAGKPLPDKREVELVRRGTNEVTKLSCFRLDALSLSETENKKKISRKTEKISDDEPSQIQ